MSDTGNESPDANISIIATSEESEAHALLQRYGSFAGAGANVEAQRRRQRENMNGYCHKKKAALDDLRVLTAQLESMLVLHASQSRSYQASYRQPQQQHQLQDDNDDESSAQQQETSPLRPSAMDTFVHLLTEKDQSEEANAALRRRVREHCGFHAIVRVTSLEDSETRQCSSQTNQDKDELEVKTEDNLGHWVAFIEGEEPFYYALLTAAQCLVMVAQTPQRVFEFQLRGMPSSTTSSGSLTRQ